jgi:hypothetical protein
VSSGAAQGWFIAGAIVFMLAGGLHVLGTLVDTVRPTYFAPVDRSVKPIMEGTGMRLVQMFPAKGDRATPSMWRVWLGPTILIGIATTCFVVAAVLSA